MNIIMIKLKYPGDFMDSDNENGWIKSTGYPTEKSIKSQIVNYLEGGVDSFKHKCQIYEEVLR